MSLIAIYVIAGAKHKSNKTHWQQTIPEENARLMEENFNVIKIGHHVEVHWDTSVDAKQSAHLEWWLFQEIMIDMENH